MRRAAGPADPQAARRGPDLTREQTATLRARQKSRNRVMLAVLLGLIVLFFALTISRMSQVSDPQALTRPGALGPAGGNAVPPMPTQGGAPSATAPSR
ncbi:hypothetical protein [Elioraea sp.]|uniref:hypothetical protein n=1 Tax=Elioraea sp. TaxID=2185103 RepID=UPI0025C324EB|nr:hypothetical protein [Elioraea sp.]